MKPTMALLIVFLTGACSKETFCQVVPGPKEFEPETARRVVLTDRPDAEQIAIENEYGARNCAWGA